jgi:hypothetical protein
MKPTLTVASDGEWLREINEIPAPFSLEDNELRHGVPRRELVVVGLMLGERSPPPADSS